ncbi:DUF3592 domain-containing protein [Arthrobacter sp. Leaf137]|uniref:DUF3592 domain-containing protein n=1 Tax=Arthrobacter sp. Leaf137 TaxID=1736271 RepID=UPI000B1E86C9|nr:DUF3592 domain-containing protein [Arthrobacter sp. Leaf137]
MDGVTGRRTDKNRNSGLTWKGKLNLAVTVLVLLLGPVMIGLGSFMIGADEDLARSGVQATGTIVHFDDVTKASERRMKVEFTSGDGASHATWATVDHDQYPIVGDATTVIYAEHDPGRAIVPGYESDGVWVRGVGTVLTFIFASLGLVVVLLMLGAYLKGRSQRGKDALSPE